jgi:hypothetical protein
MKYVKMFGLLAVAAAALMAFAGAASATTVTSPTGTAIANGTKIHAESEGGHVKLHTDIAEILCPSTVEGEITTNSLTGTDASGPITTLIFGTKATEGCTNGWVVHVNLPGSLSVRHNTGTYNGDLFSSGATVTATRFGVECAYQTNNTTIGTLTGGEHATLHIEAVIPRHGGSSLCGSSAANWTGSYTVTKPTPLFISH